MSNKLIISKKINNKGQNSHKTFSIRVKEEILTIIDEISGKTNRSRNEIVNIFLEYSIKNAVIFMNEFTNQSKSI